MALLLGPGSKVTESRYGIMIGLTEVLAILSLTATLGAVLVSAETLEIYLLVLAAVGLLIGSRVYSSQRVSTGCAYACGLLVPIIPCVGDSLLLSLVLLYALFVPRRDEIKFNGWMSWSMPLLAYVAGSVLVESAIAFDLNGGGANGFLRGVSVDTPARAVDIWRELSQTHAHTWRWLARFLVLAYVVDFFAADAMRREGFLKGLIIGVTGTAVFAIVQWLELLPFGVRNQTSFWSSIHRVSGLLSDPNALGVVMALSLWCLAWRALEFKRELGVFEFISALSMAGAGVVSGSRTFLLGCAILAAALTWHYARRFFLVGLASIAFVLCVVTALDASTTALETIQHNASIPEGFKRGISSLSLLRLSQTVASRSLFLEIAGVLVEGHTIFGVGTDRFREYVPLVGVQSGLVKGWTDNANNLYVAIGAELGLIGLILLLLVVASRTRSGIGREPLATGLLSGLGLLMITGPHTDFPEVLLLVAFLIGAATVQRAQVFSSPLIVGVALLVGGYASLTREQGIFTWDDTDKFAIRWLSNRARIELACQYAPGDSSAYAVTSLRSVYVPQKGSLRVQARRGRIVEQDLVFTSPQEVRELRVGCPHKQKKIILTLVTQPPWSPYRAWPQSSGDRRMLGVEQLVLRK